MADESTPQQPEIFRGPDPDMSERKMYFNGFSLTISPADVIITIQMQDKPLLSLHAPHGVAKTLSIKLAGVIQAMEAIAGQPFLTTDELAAGIQKKVQAQDGNTESKQP